MRERRRVAGLVLEERLACTQVTDLLPNTVMQERSSRPGGDGKSAPLHDSTGVIVGLSHRFLR